MIVISAGGVFRARPLRLAIFFYSLYTSAPQAVHGILPSPHSLRINLEKVNKRRRKGRRKIIYLP